EETCAATADKACTDCDIAYWTAFDLCSGNESCIIAAFFARRACYYNAAAAEVACRFTCCKEEYEPVRWAFRIQGCRASSFGDYAGDRVVCLNEFITCLSGPDPGGCQLAYCDCVATAETAFDLAVNACMSSAPPAIRNRDDCPDCWTRARETFEGRAISLDLYYSSNVPMPEPCLGV
ncbi:MAG TPA: hypothetical protein VF614_16710, partial [Chthoniobacteraceae bacterium]